MEMGTDCRLMGTDRREQGGQETRKRRCPLKSFNGQWKVGNARRPAYYVYKRCVRDSGGCIIQLVRRSDAKSNNKFRVTFSPFRAASAYGIPP